MIESPLMKRGVFLMSKKLISMKNHSEQVTILLLQIQKRFIAFR